MQLVSILWDTRYIMRAACVSAGWDAVFVIGRDHSSLWTKGPVIVIVKWDSCGNKHVVVPLAKLSPNCHI